MLNKTLVVLILLPIASFGLVVSAENTKKPTSIPAYSPWPFDATEAAKRQNETAKALGVQKEFTLKLGGNVTMKSILIPPGEFLMGSPESEDNRKADEGPQHRITISKAF